MKHLLVIKGDTNDSDYVTRTSVVSDADLQEIAPVIAAVKAFKPYKGTGNRTLSHNFPTSDFVRSDLGELGVYDLYPLPGLDLFMEYVPEDIHSIGCVTVYEINKVEKLL